MLYNVDRSTLVVTSLCGAALNFALAHHLFQVWRSLAWEPFSEWEGPGFSLDKDGARLICGLFSAYFAAASAICVFGFAGAIRETPPFLRIYRNYLIGDLAFFTLFAGPASSAIFDPASRSTICEHLSRHEHFLRDAVELGLNPENCEQWFERGVMVFMAVLIFFIIVRLHFIFAVSRYYAQLVHSHGLLHDKRSLAAAAPQLDDGFELRRIYLVPHPWATEKDRTVTGAPLYAPVPLAQVPSQVADQLWASAEEVWVSRGQVPHPRTSSYGDDREAMHSLGQKTSSLGPIHLSDEKP